MLIPKKYFRGRKNKNRNHAMIILFQCGKVNSQQIQDLEDRLRDSIDNTEIGNIEGVDISEDGSDGYIYISGPDANQLFGATHHILTATSFLKGATVRLRYGPPKVGVKAKEIKIICQSHVCSDNI